VLYKYISFYLCTSKYIVFVCSVWKRFFIAAYNSSPRHEFMTIRNTQCIFVATFVYNILKRFSRSVKHCACHGVNVYRAISLCIFILFYVCIGINTFSVAFYIAVRCSTFITRYISPINTYNCYEHFTTRLVFEYYASTFLGKYPKSTG
jgi:hypothetical protein